MKLYEYLQAGLNTTAVLQQLITRPGVYDLMLNGNFSTLPIYTPSDPDGAIRRGLLQKIMARYYNYSLFTPDPNYFSQRVYWQLVQIMPTYAAKFNATVSASEFEEAFLNGIADETERTRRSVDKRSATTTGSNKTTTNGESSSESADEAFSSDYPQIVAAAGDYNTNASKSSGTGTTKSSGTTEGSSTGSDTSTGESSESYTDRHVRHLSPDEILLAKQKIMQLIINIDEEIVNSMCNLFKNLWGCDCDDKQLDEITRKQLQLQNQLTSYEQQIAELSIPKLADLEVTQNGEITAEDPYIGFKTVTVNVPQPDPKTEEKTAVYVSNGTYTVTPSDGYDGLSKVTVNIAVTKETTSIAPGLFYASEELNNSWLEQYANVLTVNFRAISEPTVYYKAINAYKTEDGELNVSYLDSNGHYQTAYADGAWTDEKFRSIKIDARFTVNCNLGNWFRMFYADITSEVAKIDTVSRMDDLLTMSNVGAIYQYTGATTDSYENGSYYTITEDETVEKITFIIEYTSSSGSLDEMECSADKGNTFEGAIAADPTLGTAYFDFEITGSTIKFTDNRNDRMYTLTAAPSDTITALETYGSTYRSGG